MGFTRIYGWILIGGIAVILFILPFTGKEFTLIDSIFAVGFLIAGAILAK